MRSTYFKNALSCTGREEMLDGSLLQATLICKTIFHNVVSELFFDCNNVRYCRDN